MVLTLEDPKAEIDVYEAVMAEARARYAVPVEVRARVR
jgi:hypothetical protein